MLPVQFIVDLWQTPNGLLQVGAIIGGAGLYVHAVTHARSLKTSVRANQMDLINSANDKFAQAGMPGPASSEAAITKAALEAEDATDLTVCFYGQANVLYNVYQHRFCFSASETRHYRAWSKGVAKWALAFPQLDSTRAKIAEGAELYDDGFVRWLHEDGWLVTVDRTPPHSAAPAVVVPLRLVAEIHDVNKAA